MITFVQTNLKLDPTICSTATIKEYKEQILNLFGRKEHFIPFSWLNIEDSFGSYEEDLSKPNVCWSICPKRWFCLNYSKENFQCIGQAPFQIYDQQLRDPWWTNMVFNSIRELNLQQPYYKVI